MRLIKNKTLAQYGTVFTFDVLNKVIAGLCTIFIIRILETESYANYTLFNSIASIVASMIGSGITTGFLRMSVKNRSSGNGADGSYYTVSFIVILTFTLILLVVRRLFVAIYNTSIFIVTLSIIEAAVLSLCQLNVYVFQAREKYRIAGKIYNLKDVVIFAFLFVTFFMEFEKDTYSVIFFTILAGVLAVLMSFLIFRKERDFRFPSFDISKIEIKNLFFEIRWLICYFAILAMINASDIIILNRYSSSFYVANYGVAYKYYVLLLSLLPSISAILRVKSSTKEFEESAEKRKMYIRSWLKKTSLLSSIAVVVTPMASYFLWDLVNGDEYRIGYYCFVVFTFGAALSYMFSPMVNFVLSANLHKSLCFVSLFALIFNWIGNYILVQHYAAIGVSVTTVLSQAIINLGGTVVLLSHDRAKDK